jgi:hypothetical protein
LSKRRLGWRSRAGAVVSAFVLVGIGLAVGGNTPVQAAVSQNGPLKNYAGPGPCPAGTIQNSSINPCLITNGDINVVQRASGVGSANIVETGSAAQNVTADQGGGAPNSVTCTFSSTDAGTATTSAKQLCQATQDGDNGNTVKVSMSTAPSTTTLLDMNGLITQNNDQRLIVKQTSTSGANTVTGSDPSTGGVLSMNQQISQQVNSSTPLHHKQDTFQLASVSQVATTSGNNTVTLSLSRTQGSFVRGTIPEEKQDTNAPPSAEGLCPTTTASSAARNGNVCLFQRTNSGTQTDKIRAADNKSEQATDISLTNQQATQQQGPTAPVVGGWLMAIDMDQGTAGTGTVDLGDPASCPPDTKTDCSGTPGGVTKNWSMTAQNVLGQPVAGTSSQNDGILDNLIGKSPTTGTSSSWTKLAGRPAGGADPGTKQVAVLDSFGHTKVGWSGFIAAQMNDQGKRLNWSSQQNVSEHLGCTDTANGVGSNCSTITASPATFSAVEGASTSGTVATLSDPNPNDTAASFDASINWGDESSSAGSVVPTETAGLYNVVGTHQYKEEGPYAITVTVTRHSDNSQVATANSTANVTDAPITVTAASGPIYSSGSVSGVPVATINDANPFGTAGDFTATIDWGDGSTSAGTVSGSGPFTVNGSHTYSSANVGKQFVVKTSVADDGGSTGSTNPGLTITTYKCASTSGCFTVGNQASLSGQLYYWGNDWAVRNPMSGTPSALVPASFKGFNNDSAPACSGANASWTSTGGTSPPPAGTLPTYMAVVVSSKVLKAGSIISGDVVKVIVVKTDPGYSPNSGGVATGTYVTTICG